jgi:DNA-binding PadR family transcriptional regulator
MAAMANTRDDEALLLGEWACLGILAAAPSHGYDVAARLAPTGDVGRVWTLSRPLTYRALDQLAARDYVEVVGEERGRAGGTRTILRPTRRGRAALRRWLAAPVTHLRDVRNELVVKLVVCEMTRTDRTALVSAQRAMFAPAVARLVADAADTDDVVAIWRSESSQATLRFLDRLSGDRTVK